MYAWDETDASQETASWYCIFRRMQGIKVTQSLPVAPVQARIIT